MEILSRIRIVLFAAFVVLVVLMAGGGGKTAVSVRAAEPSPQGISMAGRQVIIRAGYNPVVPDFVPPPKSATRPSRIQTATINVNYIGSWDAQAQNAFQYAVDIWETQITSPVPIAIDAEWSSLGSGILGGAGAKTYFRDFTNAPVSATWYPIAMANSLAGYDLDPGQADISAQFNKDFSSWYFGTNSNPPFTKYDFVSVVLHEIGHGLGFAGSMVYSGGIGAWGLSNDGITYYPTIYDRFSENGSGQSLINTALFGNPSSALGSQLTSGNLYFDSPNARAANGGSPPRLYAPGTWQQGSSYSHLDESTFGPGTANSLMTPIINNGEANHDPGPITMGMFKDMGWVTFANTNPTLTGIPDQPVPMNTTADNAIDLWSYATDSEDADSQLSFIISNSPDANAGVTIDSNRYVDISPVTNWQGSTTVTIQVTDSGGLVDSDSFLVTVANTPPEFTSTPVILMAMNTTNSQAVDLWAVTTDLQTSDANLNFQITDSGNPNAGITLNSNRYISAAPTPGWTGQTTITVRATDAHSGQSDLNINVIIAAEIFDISLPIIQKN